MRNSAGRFKPTILSLATAYADQAEGRDELVIPESFDSMEFADVQALYDSAVEAFDALYAEEDRSPERNAQLAQLTEGIESIAAELAAREAAAAERAQEAAGYAERVAALRASTDSDEGDGGEGEGEGDGEGEEGEEEEVESDDESAAQTVTAAGTPAPRTEVRVPLSNVRRQAAATPPAPATPSMTDVTFASGEGLGVAVGTGLDWMGIGRAIDRKLQGYNSSQYESAARMGRHVKEQHGIFSVRREFPAELMINSSDREHVENVLNYAVDETRLPQGGLVASGGWCAPSETIYDLLEMESRDGLLSLPEVGISRGGINFTPGPSFAELYAAITGFHFTEEEDEDGKYTPGDEGNVVGPKPCYTVECPDFTDHRLEVSGMCIQAGLLMARGYPEVIARTVRGALIAHEHRLNAMKIQRLVAGSTAVTMPTQQAGTVAPLLTSIELQVEHYRYTHRLARSTSLEAVFPFWVRGAVRSDLSRRLGVDMIDVPDSRIDAWFRSRGVNPQFVYNWQALDTTATASFTAWPSSVDFLLYAAGTWISGASEIITVDTLYDSTLLANNDYTALFTEEGWLVAKRGHDSRVVTVGICPDGATHQGIAIECDGTVGAGAPGSSEENPLFTSEVTE